MRFELSESEIGKCLSFSFQLTEKTKDYYQLRNKYARTEKLILDQFIGKLAEIATYKYLDSRDYECTYPQFKFKADNGDLKAILEDRNIIIHVKCVRSDSPVKDSWLIEKNEIPSLNEDHYFSLCKFHSPNEIEICKLISSQDIIWRDPVHKSLYSKAACYLKDM